MKLIYYTVQKGSHRLQLNFRVVVHVLRLPNYSGRNSMPKFMSLTHSHCMLR